MKGCSSILLLCFVLLGYLYVFGTEASFAEVGQPHYSDDRTGGCIPDPFAVTCEDDGEDLVCWVEDMECDFEDEHYDDAENWDDLIDDLFDLEEEYT